MDLPNNNNKDNKDNTNEESGVPPTGEHVCGDNCERADHLVQLAITMSERILATADKDAIDGLLTGKAIHPDELAMLASCQVMAKLADRAGRGGALQAPDKFGAEGVRAHIDDTLYWMTQLCSEAYRRHTDGKGSVKLTAEYRDV
ncbi:MAG: hypothetical protein ACXABY_09000 [Candidatus Thorarchaeota archaeon]|jgi:hypothetical protein